MGNKHKMLKLKKKLNRKQLTLLLGGLAIAALVGIALFMTLNDSSNDTSTVNPTTTDSSSSSTPSSSTDSNNSSKGTASSDGTKTVAPTNTETPSATLQAPGGPLLSSHSAGQADKLYSSCQTVANTKCDIRVTSANGSTVKLVGQTTGQKTTTDGNGFISFYWQPSDLSLTPGDWKVVAVATSGNQTAVSASETLVVK